MSCVCEFVTNFNMLVKTDDNTERKNSLAGARILNLLNNAQPETYSACHYFTNFILDLKYLLLTCRISVDEHSIWHDGMEVSKIMGLKVFCFHG